jgi:uncharacterized protein YfiM (DUF2279 family)
MKPTLIAFAAAAMLATAPAAAGCLTGAAVGGTAGHFAGHHAVLGAAAGCAYGHHRAVVKKREATAQAAAARTASPAPATH